MSVVANQFANQEIFLPKAFSETYVKLLVGRGGDSIRPFSRQIDLWWLALCLGFQAGRRVPSGPRDQLVKFNDGGILGSDPWRITHLELFGLAELGEGGLEDPAAVIQRASEYANAGLDIIEEICVATPEPTLAIMNRITEFVDAPAGADSAGDE